jgi:hypothetical protein
MDKNTMYVDLLEHLDAASVLAARLGLPSEGLHVYHDAVLYARAKEDN